MLKRWWLGLSLWFISVAVMAAPYIVPSAPSIAGNSYVLMDFNSKHLLASNNPDMQVEPASITKIMTAYAVFNELKQGNIKLTDLVTISKKAWKTPGSRMFVEVGKQIPVEQLLKGMIIQSGNDASVALAEHIAGSEAVFAELMNQYAKELGMKNTHFKNATGLPHPEHVTTARDLALLAQATISQFPEYYKWYSERKFTFNNITQYNRNKLLWRDETVDGMKTGHTNSAGYCLLSSAKRQDMRLISVVLGTSSAAARAVESQKLLNYGFRFFETHKLYSAGEKMGTTQVWLGKTKNVDVVLNEDLVVTIPRGQYENIEPKVTFPSEVTAPIAEGQDLGKLELVLHDKVILEKPLHAATAVAEGSWFSQLMDKIKLFFRSIFG